MRRSSNCVLHGAAALLLGLVLTACAQPASQPTAAGAEAPKVGPFVIYRDASSKENHGSWTVYMLPKEQEKRAADMIKISRIDATDPHEGKEAVRCDVDFAVAEWCALGVVCTADYTGKDPSDSAYDLTAYTTLVFWARGETGDERIEVKVAGFGDQKYGDSAKTAATTGVIHLTKGWTKYTLSVRRIDRTRVISPLIWAASRDANSADKIRFYLDDISFINEDSGK